MLTVLANSCKDISRVPAVPAALFPPGKHRSLPSYSLQCRREWYKIIGVINKPTLEWEQVESAGCGGGGGAEQSKGESECMEEVAGARGSSYNLVGIGATGKLMSEQVYRGEGWATEKHIPAEGTATARLRVPRRARGQRGSKRMRRGCIYPSSHHNPKQLP